MVTAGGSPMGISCAQWADVTSNMVHPRPIVSPGVTCTFPARSATDVSQDAP